MADAGKEAGTSGAGTDTDMPRALVRRLVKGKLDELSASLGDGKKDFQLSKDALIAFAESAKVFISYLAATANEVCKEARRATVSAEDVLQALDDMDFGEFQEPIRAFMAEHKEALKGRLEKKSAYKKRAKAGQAGAVGGAEAGESGPAGEEGEGGDAAQHAGGSGEVLPAAAAAGQAGPKEGGDVEMAPAEPS